MHTMQWTKSSNSGEDSDEDNVLAGNDDMEGEEDESASRRFLSQMAKSEKGEARWVSTKLALDAFYVAASRKY